VTEDIAPVCAFIGPHALLDPFDDLTIILALLRQWRIPRSARLVAIAACIASIRSGT
jgi:hypothetical protein